MMTKDFEKYFPLPWSRKESCHFYSMGYGERYTFLDLNSPDGAASLVDFTISGDMNRDEERARRAIVDYIVLCANLMPECETTLRRTREELSEICSERCNAPFDECGSCDAATLIARIDNLLAKLEGGNDNEPR